MKVAQNCRRAGVVGDQVVGVMRPKNWTHDRYSFFKYTDYETAKKILTSRALRWTSPLDFNDPFDIQFDLHLDIDAKKATQQCLEELWNIHYVNQEFEPANTFGNLVRLLRGPNNKPIKPPTTKDQFFKFFGSAVEEGIRNGNAALPKLQEELRAELRGVKVLCLSEIRDSIPMWSHYSQHHTGVVLELCCVPEVDSNWGVAKPVIYCAEMPRLFDEQALVRIMSGQAATDPKLVHDKLVYSKAMDWAYEKEWRVILHGQDPTSSKAEIRFDERELAAIYLGCRMTDDHRLELSALTAPRFPKAKIFLAKQNPREFKLDFDQLLQV